MNIIASTCLESMCSSQALGRGYLDNTDQLVEDIIFHIDLAVKLNKNDFEAHRMLAEVHLSMHSFEEAN